MYCISIHALRGEGDSIRLISCNTEIFQSTPSEGRATSCSSRLHLYQAFQSTPSEGRATNSQVMFAGLAKFQSTPSEGRATREEFDRLKADYDISIHALRGEGDWLLCKTSDSSGYISIHALRGEGDRWDGTFRRPAWHFNPRPPRGGRLSTPPGNILP